MRFRTGCALGSRSWVRVSPGPVCNLPSPVCVPGSQLQEVIVCLARPTSACQPQPPGPFLLPSRNRTALPGRPALQQTAGFPRDVTVSLCLTHVSQAQVTTSPREAAVTWGGRATSETERAPGLVAKPQRHRGDPCFLPGRQGLAKGRVGSSGHDSHQRACGNEVAGSVGLEGA